MITFIFSLFLFLLYYFVSSTAGFKWKRRNVLVRARSLGGTISDRFANVGKEAICVSGGIPRSRHQFYQLHR